MLSAAIKRRSPPPLPRAQAITLPDSDLVPCQMAELAELQPVARTPPPPPSRKARNARRRLAGFGVAAFGLAAASLLFVYLDFGAAPAEPQHAAVQAPVASVVSVAPAASGRVALRPAALAKLPAKARTVGHPSAPPSDARVSGRALTANKNKAAKAARPKPHPAVKP